VTDAVPWGASAGSLVLQHNNVAGGSAGKQRPDQLHGHRLVTLRTLIPFQAVGERMCVGDVKWRGGVSGLLKVVLLQVSTAPGGAHSAGTLTRVAYAHALFREGR